MQPPEKGKLSEMKEFESVRVTFFFFEHSSALIHVTPRQCWSLRANIDISWESIVKPRGIQFSKRLSQHSYVNSLHTYSHCMYLVLHPL